MYKHFFYFFRTLDIVINNPLNNNNIYTTIIKTTTTYNKKTVGIKFMYLYVVELYMKHTHWVLLFCWSL